MKIIIFITLLIAATYATSIKPAPYYVQHENANPVPVTTYVMSKCPFCAEWANSFQKQVMTAEGVPQIITLRLDYAGHVDSSEPLGFKCLHGPGECLGNMYELCVYNLTNPGPNNYVWWDFFVCMDQNQGQIPDNAKSCADKLKINYAAIDTCANSALGKALFTASIERTIKSKITGTPTVFINGQEYGGNLSLRKICQAYQGTKPKGCDGAF